MNQTENQYEAYVYAIKEQLAQHIAGLDELSDAINQAPLSFNERSAVERSMQVVVESAIGCSKHFLKSKDKPVPSDARSSIERTCELLKNNHLIGGLNINDLRAAVGMRNAIIHDYLNLDWARIEPVLATRKYQLISDYINAVANELLGSGRLT